jgi:hypothetical protein
MELRILPDTPGEHQDGTAATSTRLRLILIGMNLLLVETYRSRFGLGAISMTGQPRNIAV